MKKIIFFILVCTTFVACSNEKQVTVKEIEKVINKELVNANIRDIFEGYTIKLEDFKDEAPWGDITLNSNYSEILFTYNNHMFLFLCETTERGDVILDAIIIEMLNEHYTLSSGPVEINNDYFDWDIHVLITGPWENGINENIQETYKSNLETLRIEKKVFESVRLHSEV